MVKPTQASVGLYGDRLNPLIPSGFDLMMMIAPGTTVLRVDGNMAHRNWTKNDEWETTCYPSTPSRRGVTFWLSKLSSWVRSPAAPSHQHEFLSSQGM